MLVLFVLEKMVWHRGLKFSLPTKERRTTLTYIYNPDALEPKPMHLCRNYDNSDFYCYFDICSTL